MAPQRPIAVASESLELLDHATAFDMARTRLAERPELRTLHDEARTRGFSVRDRPEDAFGIRVRSTATADVRPPRGEPGAPVRTVEFELAGQSFSRGDDEGALATAVVRGGRNELAYHFLLEAPGGNFQQAREFAVENDAVVEALSWWTAWTGCLSRDCASTCLGSLLSCAGTWAAYFWCVVAACGGCVLKCAGCATCDCGWWCRWAAGCCSQ
jgi:hypothetical protein